MQSEEQKAYLDCMRYLADDVRRRFNTYGQLTLDGGRKVSSELMTRYFRMLRYKLEQSNG